MRPPDLANGPIRAWVMNHEHAKTEPAHEGSIRVWVVNGPFHPVWSWWLLGMAHLRDIPGAPPAELQYPGAEYEFIIVAFNPDRGVPDIDAMERGENWGTLSIPKFLLPADAVVQFDGVSDSQAAAICDRAAAWIVEGRMSPDQDYRAQWERSVRSVARGAIHGK